eukprot:1547090-Rhodomonas_salina.1
MPELAWTVPPIPDKLRPPARCYHAACVINDRWMVIHGGWSGVKLLCCTWIFDLLNSKWQRTASPHGGLIPSGRYGHTLTYVPERKEILLLGGLDQQKKACKDALYTLDP